MKINHYTTIDTLELILMNQTLRFNRLDKVYDKQETELVSQEDWSKFIFVSSWSADEYENHAMWGYPGLNGVMIGLPKFPFKKYKLETKESLNFFSKGNMDCPIPFEQIYNKEWMFIVPPSNMKLSVILLNTSLTRGITLSLLPKMKTETFIFI
ncbi:hypothetical protein KO519_03600 [Paraglaciecola agarilytica]|uniref:hypothetical protein n=1 Tax=Paraglaciecola chathamensis TaxID=368405 RepID=UPI001C08BFF9|nr:hypothetical protein [Paraglaciecola agarilytica]MBU3016785.1 hypothetical protein [Paraglaciecola agarilytica]